METTSGTVSLPLAECSARASAQWLILCRIEVTHRGQVFAIGGIWPGQYEDLQAAIDDAKRREDLHRTLDIQQRARTQAAAEWDDLTNRSDYLANSTLETFCASLAGLTWIPESDSDLLDRRNRDDRHNYFRLYTIQKGPRSAAECRNQAFIQQELVQYKQLFDTVESHPLTDDQRIAVVCDEDNSLVIAGAGTGKTSTIVAKVGYLLAKQTVQPDEILLLAYNRDAADELRERIQKRVGVPVTVRTFHALGLEIIGQARGAKPSLSNAAGNPDEMRRMLTDLIKGLLCKDEYRELHLSFQTLLRRPYQSAWEFNSDDEYRDYLIDVGPRDFKGTMLRSYEECEIANWLFLHGIAYEYEQAYPVNTATPEHRQYKPDFYLTDYDIYIEHQALGRDGNPPPFMDQVRYREKVDWVRKTHERNETTLIETFSWERHDGVLLTNLHRKLEAHGVAIGEVSADDALARLNKAGVIDPFADLAAGFLTLFKSGGYSLDEVAATTSEERERVFLKLFRHLFDAYEAALESQDEIDFDDMISHAADLVREGAYQSRFRYIIIDEFQDIARGRADLVLALRAQVPGSKVMCVGDDWQSIYRFAGSDLSLMTEFERYFGFTKRSVLSQTFRFGQSLADFSARFITKNPVQIGKALTGREPGEARPVVVYHSQMVEETFAHVLAETAGAGAASVFVLRRFKHLVSPSMEKMCGRYPNVTIETVHRSKGREADYVILVGVGSGKFGFPSDMSDDPILDLVLAVPDGYPRGEERRLFYVALTRAKRRVYVIATGSPTSAFVQELQTDPKYSVEVKGTRETADATCPECRRGFLQCRSGKSGAFYGCSYYPLCEYTESACRSCGSGRVVVAEDRATCSACRAEQRRCQRCEDGILVLRRRQRDGSQFYGCSNYPPAKGGCRYTEEYDAAIA